MMACESYSNSDLIPDKLIDPPVENRQSGRRQNLQDQPEYSFIAYPNLRDFALAREDLKKRSSTRRLHKDEQFTFDDVFA